MLRGLSTLEKINSEMEFVKKLFSYFSGVVKSKDIELTKDEAFELKLIFEDSICA